MQTYMASKSRALDKKTGASLYGQSTLTLMLFSEDYDMKKNDGLFSFFNCSTFFEEGGLLCVRN